MSTEKPVCDKCQHPQSYCECPAPTKPNEPSALDAAYQRLMLAFEEYGKLAPKRQEPTDPPKIIPTLRHAAPKSFQLGTNMMLDSGGYMPGKIPVVVIPARPEDLRKYRRQGYTIKRLLKTLLLDSPK